MKSHNPHQSLAAVAVIAALMASSSLAGTITVVNLASWANQGVPQPGAQALLPLTQTNGLAAGHRFYPVAVDPPGGSN